MENYVSFNVKERFPVGNKGVALLQYPTEPPHFEICLYDRDNPLMFYGQIRETSERRALNIYLKRCDTLVEQYEQKTEQQFPLPSTAMAVLTSTGDLVIIRRGMTGYYPSDWNVPGDRKRNEETASYHNAQHELTKAQCAAMVCGSMFGWDVPGANPELYDSNGKFKTMPEDKKKTEFADDRSPALNPVPAAPQTRPKAKKHRSGFER